MPRLTDQLDARLTDPVRPGRVHTDAGALRWDGDGVWLGEARLERPAVQLSREPVRPAAGWRRLWPWRRRPRLLAELRSGTRRARLAARVPPQQLDGLAELALTAPTVMPGPQLIDLLHAVRVADGRFVVANPGLPGAVPQPAIERPDEPTPEASRPRRPRWRPALRRRLASLRSAGSELARRFREGATSGDRARRTAVARCWRLAVGLVPMWLLPLLAATMAVAPLPGLTSLSMRVLMPVGFVVVSVLAGAGYAGVQRLRGRLDALQAGAATGFGLGLAAVSMWLATIIWDFMDFGDGIYGWMLATLGLFVTLGTLRLTGAMTGEDASNTGAFAPFMAMIAIPGPHWLFYLPGGVALATRFGAKLGDPTAFARREHDRKRAEARERRRRRGF